MFTQLVRLNLETDGSYGSNGELQFLESYLDSAETRISAYEKIRDNADEIVSQVEKRMHELNKDNKLFVMGNHEIEICRRDRKNAILYACSAMLFNDLNRLREGALLWLQTIVRATGYKNYVRTHYPVIQEVIQEYLTLEEAAVILPALQLDQTILGD